MVCGFVVCGFVSAGFDLGGFTDETSLLAVVFSLVGASVEVSVEGAELISLDAEILAFDGAKDYHTQSLQVLRANASDRELPLETKEQLAELLGANAAETLLDLGATEIVAEIQKSRAERAARLSAPHQK